VTSAARKRAPRDGTFTATDVADFCRVDLKTIHNWVARGVLPASRTPGRHLRFHGADVADFLRGQGFPVPVSIRRAQVAVACAEADPSMRARLERALAPRFSLSAFADALEMLLSFEERTPEAIVLGAPLRHVDLEVCVQRLRAHPRTAHVRLVVFAPNREKLPAEVQKLPVVQKPDAEPIRAIVEELLGLDPLGLREAPRPSR
jgi:excisionase family DNA binding protein